jgi:hypothetical protein
LKGEDEMQEIMCERRGTEKKEGDPNADWKVNSKPIIPRGSETSDPRVAMQRDEGGDNWWSLGQREARL